MEIWLPKVVAMMVTTELEVAMRRLTWPKNINIILGDEPLRAMSFSDIWTVFLPFLPLLVARKPLMLS